MSTKTADVEESTATLDLETPRAVRAVTECMSVLEDAPGIYTVVSESGAEYTVDVREGRCTCPDVEHNLAPDEACKHELRVLAATGRVAIPEWADEEAMDDMLGAHVDGGPQAAAVATDGGVQVGAETDDVADERPDECECSGHPDEWIPCWYCYAQDFVEPNPDAEFEGGAEVAE